MQFAGDVVRAWISEKQMFVYSGPQNDTVGHYTQVVSNLAAKIGCGAAKCGSSLYAYCNYASAQMSVDNPYTIGKACSSCPNSCVNNMCTCSKVCQNGGTLSK